MLQISEISYPILNEEENKELLKKCKNGDFKSREKLILHHMKLVIFVVNRFKFTEIETEELISIGTIGLIKAIDSFDPERNFKFATYSYRCIENEILMYLRKLKKTEKDIIIYTVLLSNNDGKDATIENTLADEHLTAEEAASINAENEALLEIIEQLPPKKREMIKLHFGFYDDIPYTQREIADKFGLSQSYISRNITSALKNIKQKYIKML